MSALNSSRPLACGRHPMASHIALVMAIALLAVVFYRTAWISDDAYISFRTLDNFLNGYGLRWNVHERVQSFTHPLWFFLILPFAALTQNVFLSTLVLSLLLTAATFWILVNRALPARNWSATVLVALLLCGSNAFMDYSSSGLENPLSHLLAVCFALVLTGGAGGRTRPLMLGSLACALMLNRLDMAVLVAPGLLLECLPRHRWRNMAWMALGFVPLLAWEVFSLVYYGSLVPNTAYAKLGANVPRPDLAWNGVGYLYESLANDPATLLAILAAVIVTALQPRNMHRLALLAGMLAYLAYVVYVGGDFMSGRFLTTPFIVAVFLLAAGLSSLPRLPAFVLLSLALAGAITAIPRWHPAFGYPAREIPLFHGGGVTDERAHYFADYGLVGVLASGRTAPAGPWQHDPETLARWRSEPVQYRAVGTRSFHAGPQAVVIDPLALTDPFLARLPAVRGSRVGHYERLVPDAYMASLAGDAPVLEEAALARLYTDVALVTRGDIWSAERWQAISRLLAGSHSADIARTRYADAARTIMTPVTHWQASALFATTGVITGTSRQARTGIHPAGFITHGPYERFWPGYYELVLHYRGNGSGTAGELEVFAADSGETVARRPVPATQDAQGVIVLPFFNQYHFLTYEFRTAWFGKHDIEVTGIALRPISPHRPDPP